MRFVLRYRGPLRANGDPSHKHKIRTAFHVQLNTLWNQLPLSEEEQLIRPRIEGVNCLLRPLGPFTFAPLVTAEMFAIAKLQLTFLRPEAPGHLITQGGDIDNRLKTLFDSLTMPRHLNALPSGAPEADQTPFFCLLEDDNLVTAFSVRTEQLLEPTDDASFADITIDVDISVTRQTWGNLVLS